MGLTVTTVAPYTRLTDVASVQAALGIATDAALIGDYIDAASAAIVSYCGRPFGREAYTETLPGFGGIHLQLRRTPIVTVSTVTKDTGATVVTDYSINEPGRGWLYRRAGWSWTVQTYPGLSGGGAWLDMGTPLPAQEEPSISVSYIAGYIMPEQNVTDTVSVAQADQSFNTSASNFPALLKAGDIVFASGFSNAVNNGQFVVTGTPTTAKIIVSSTVLVNETAGAGKALKLQNLPKDVQLAATEAAKSFYMTRKDDPSIVEKQLGPARLRYSEQQDMLRLGLPAVCVGLLRPWVRGA